MNKHGQLTHFISRMVSDSRLKPVHISLSIAICHCWISNQFQHSYRVSRSILMKASRIRSKATYHKALRELQIYGYVKYAPSYHPVKASEFRMVEENKDSNGQNDASFTEAKATSTKDYLRSSVSIKISTL